MKNYNNGLACDAFVQINFEPTRPITDKDLETVFPVKHEGQEIFVKLVDVLRFYFKDMPGIATIPAMGMEAEEWRKWWISAHQDTKPDTMMWVYYYKRVKG